MSKVLNMAGGGGGSLRDTDAVLLVTVPTGSTVTATKGGITLLPIIWTKSADNTLDCALFSILASTFDSNDWTVSATLGGDSATGTVVIDAAEKYEIELSYRTWLIQNGVILTENLTAVGKKRESSSTLSATAPNVTYEQTYVQVQQDSYGAGIAYFPQSIDVTDFSVLHLDGTCMNGTSLLTNLCFQSWTAIGSYQNSNRVFEQQLMTALGSTYVSFSFDIDISSFTGNIFIGFNTSKASNGTYSSVRAVNVYLI